ncbi:MAG TPA: hypothetical protein VMM15_31610 [Bradyrhizobium sp.]|nr:hypothetical protein [Bradyrhizobium sp.]
MAEEPETIVAKLKERRLPGRVDRKNTGIRGKHRAIAHVDCDGKRFRQMTAERLQNNASRRVNDETQWSFFSAATARGCEDAAASAYADHREAAREKVPHQPQFRPKAGQQVAADDAQRPCTEKNEAIIVLGRGRNGSSGRKRPAIAEADVAALEVIFHQAEIVRLKMLQHAERLHGHCRNRRNT